MTTNEKNQTRVLSKAELEAAIAPSNWAQTTARPVVGYRCLDFLTDYTNTHALFNQEELNGLIDTDRDVQASGHTKTQYLRKDVRILKHKTISSFYFLVDHGVVLVNAHGRALKAVDIGQFIQSKEYHVFRPRMSAFYTGPDGGGFDYSDWE